MKDERTEAMSDTTLTKTRLADGVWEGILTLAEEFDTPPPIRALYLDQVLEGLELRPDEVPGRFTLRLELPIAMLSDGMQTVLFVNAETDETLASATILAGDVLAEDIRLEMDLLRAELDMLKRAFRRHCVETM